MSSFSVSLVSANSQKEISSDSVYLQTDFGDITILKNHADFVSSVDSGVATISEDGRSEHFRIQNGMVYMNNGRCRIVALSIEHLK